MLFRKISYIKYYIDMESAWTIKYEHLKSSVDPANIRDLGSLREIIRTQFDLGLDNFAIRFTIGSDQTEQQLDDQHILSELKAKDRVSLIIQNLSKQKVQSHRQEQFDSQAQRQGAQKSQPKEDQFIYTSNDNNGNIVLNERPFSMPYFKYMQLVQDKLSTDGPVLKDIGDKIIYEPEIEANPDQQLYFQCKKCQRRFKNGPRYICFRQGKICDYDACEPCYKNDKHQIQGHRIWYIQNKAHWRKYDFFPLLQAFVNPHFGWTQPSTYEQVSLQQFHQWHQDIPAYIHSQMDFYNRRLDRYTSEWIYTFSNIQTRRQQKEKKRLYQLKKQRGLLRPEEQDSDLQELDFSDSPKRQNQAQNLHHQYLHKAQIKVEQIL